MKQLVVNILVSLVLLGAVAFVATLEMPNSRASAAQLPGIMVDSADDGQLQLHGFGFRPGTIVSLQLKQRDADLVLSSTNAFVDSGGGFTVELDTLGARQQMASLQKEPLSGLDQGASTSLDNMVILASSSAGIITLPVQANRIPQ